MIFKTKNPAGENRPLSKWEINFINKPLFLSVVSLLLFVLLLILLLQFINPGVGIYPFPGVMAAGEQVMNGIKLFSGDPIETGWTGFHTASLLSILIIYFALPVFFVYSIINWIKTPADERVISSFRKTYFSVLLGGVVITAIVLMHISGLFGSITVRKNITASQNASIARDYLTEELTEIIYDAQMKYYMPAQSGGFNGNWQNYKLPANIRNEEIAKRFEYYASQKMENNLFLLKPDENDTTIIVTGVGFMKAGRDPEFKNADGRKGLIQIHAVITPNTHRVNIDQ